jgi:hypothetical protein
MEKATDMKKDMEKDMEKEKERDKVEEEDEGNPLIASWFGGESDSAFNMVDKDFVDDIMDVANEAAIVVLNRLLITGLK